MHKHQNKISLFYFIWSNKKVLSLVAFFMLLYAIFENAIPYSMAFIIDYGFRGKSLAVINIVFITLIVLGIAITLSQVFRDYLYLDFCSRFLKNIRLKTFSTLQNLSMCFYSKTAPGEVISRFSTDLATVEQGLTSAPAQFIIPCFSAIITITLLFVLNVPLALISMLVFPAFFVGPYILTPHASKAGIQRKKSEAVTISDVQTNITAQSVIKSLNLQNPAIEFFKKNNTYLHKKMLKSLFYSSLLERSSISATILLQVIVFAIGAYMTFWGCLEIGELVAFQGLFLGLTYNILYCSNFIPNIIQGKVGLNRINELIKEVPTVIDLSDAEDLAQFNREIRFDNVTFSYSPGKVNLSNINLTIPKGANVAFIGESGCGKSTILNLLMRFYDINEGSITIDGKDIRTVTQCSIRQQLGIVLQDNILFNMSILENIRLGKLEASEEEIFEAAKKAEIHDFIMSLPDGYNTLAGERGGQLSGGQRQRIAIARSLLHGGNILILDEATSALDPVTQKSLDQTIANIGKNGMTIISVTHRLSTITQVDKIFVIEKGEITEAGSHNELLKLNGSYKRMWQKQTVPEVNS